MKYGLPESVTEKICHVLSKYPQVEKATLYGSRAKGNYKNGSDIDLTLHGNHLNLNILYRIMDEIDDLLLPYTVDVSIFNMIHDSEVVEHINRVGITFYNQKENTSTLAISYLIL
jgi:predicted nucleotidyltransferase